MFKNFLKKLNKYKLLIILLIIIILLVVIKINFGQEEKSVTSYSSTENSEIINESERQITPTEIINSENEETIVPTETDEESGYIKMSDYFFPHEEETFLAEKYENNKIYVRSKIDDRERAERNLKYWYYVEMEGDLLSENIVWE